MGLCYSFIYRIPNSKHCDEIMKINKIILITGAVALGAIITLFCMHKERHVIQLPALTGPFAVGTTKYHLIDKSRKENASKNPEDYRELMVHIWYPIDKNIEGEPYPYLSQEMPYVKHFISEQSHTPLEKLGFLDVVKTRSIYNASVSSSNTRWPVVIFSPGVGTGVVRSYTSVLEDLASHGYIVVGIDHPYDNLVTFFPDGRIIRPEDAKPVTQKPVDNPNEMLEIRSKGLSDMMDRWVQDTKFVLDKLEKMNINDPNHLLTSKLDLSHIGIFGHSFGGATAVQVCRQDSRCKAGILIDGSPEGKDAQMAFDKPFMFLEASQSVDLGNYPPDEMLEKMHMTKADVDKVIIDYRSAIENLFNYLLNDAYLAILKKADHMSFTDYPFLLPSLPPGTIAPLKGIEITRKLVVDFFDVYLKNKDRNQFIALLKGLPEITEKIKIKK